MTIDDERAPAAAPRANPARKPLVEAIGEEALDALGAFLHEHLNPKHSPEAWVRQFRAALRPESPNYGYMLRDEGRIVGAIGALYVRRPTRLGPQLFCNITSWCVLDEFRAQSMRLAMALVAQPDTHFTDFSPTRVVSGTLKFLKFAQLDDRVAVMPHWPQPWARGRVLHRPKQIEQALAEPARQAYRDHAGFPWLRHLVLTDGAATCHVIYKPERLRGLPTANIVHVGDRRVFDRCFARMASHLFWHGILFSRIELRLLNRTPRMARVQTGFVPKVFLSKGLSAADIDYLYSETLAFDL